MTHYIKKCKHGTLVATCKCASANKEVLIVSCPAHCAGDNIDAEVARLSGEVIAMATEITKKAAADRFEGVPIDPEQRIEMRMDRPEGEEDDGS